MMTDDRAVRPKIVVIGIPGAAERRGSFTEFPYDKQDAIVAKGGPLRAARSTAIRAAMPPGGICRSMRPTLAVTGSTHLPYRNISSSRDFSSAECVG